MVRVAGPGSQAGKRSRCWGKVGAGPRRDQTLPVSSRDIWTAMPGFLPTSSMLCQFGYNFPRMTMSAFKRLHLLILNYSPLVWESNTLYLWYSRKIKRCLVNKQAQTSLTQHRELKYFTQLLNGTWCSLHYNKLFSVFQLTLLLYPWQWCLTMIFFHKRKL